ncbi:MAG: PAS domain S-box protein [Bacteroidales bacterium]|nr:PAS domain S-box protein [Bacteroidales bacterium]
MDDQEKTRQELAQINEELQSAKESTEESETTYRMLYESIQDAMFASELKDDGTLSHFILVNDIACQLLGYSRKELLSKSPFDINSEKSKQEFNERIQMTIEKGHVIFQTEHVAKDGRIIPIELSTNIIHFRSKTIFHSLARDITERKQTEESIRLSEELLSSYMKFSPIYSYIKEVSPTESRVLKASDNFIDMIGIPGSEIIGKTMQEIYPEPFADKMSNDDWIVVSNEEIIQLDEEFNDRYYSTIKYPISLGDKKLLAGYTIEITERKLSEERLQKSEESLSITLNSIGDAVISTDIEGLVIRMNPVAEKLCGWKLAEALGKPLDEVFHIINVQTRDTVANPVSKVLENGEIVGLANHTALISKDGTEYQIADSAAAIKNKEGQISGVVLVFSDVTEKYAAQKQLEESEEKFRLLISAMNQGMALHEIITDEDGKPVDYVFLDINDSYTRLVGSTREQLIGKRVREVMPDVEQYWIENYGKVALTGEPSYFENYFATNDKYYSTYSYRPKKNQFAVLVNDITERKKFEESLLKSEENLSITLHSIGDGFISTDMHGMVVQMNPVAEKLCGWALADAVGRPLEEVFHIINSESRNTVANPVTKVLENGEIVGLANHTALISKDGTEYQIADSAAPIKNKEGEISGVVLVFSDVTEKYASQKQLEESEEKFRLLITSMDQGMALHEIITDENGVPVDYVFLDINEKYTKLLGVTREMSIGRRIREVMPKVEQYWIDIFGKVALTGEPSYYENYLETTGKYYSTYSYCPKKYQFAVLVNDITERKNAEKALRESEETFRNYFENSPIGKSITGIDGSLKVNKAFCNMLGYSREELTHLDWMKLTHPGDLQLSQDGVNLLITGEKDVVYFEKRYIHKDGHVIWAEVNTTLQKDAQGKPSNFITTIQDITERKKAEDAIREKEVQYRNLANSGLALIWTSNTDKLCTYFNEPWLKFTGRTLEEEYGNGWAEGVHPDDFDRCLETYVTAFEKRESFVMEYRLKHHSGEYRWILDMGTPNFNSNGEFVGYIGHCIDISERKHMEEDLITAKERAEESDRLKSAFLANMSHEIRTPMNGILGFAEILKEPDLTGEEQQNYIDIIQSSGKRMLNIINDIIDVSKIEAGLMKIEIKETNINEQIKYMYTFFKPEVEAKGMKLSFRISLPAAEATIKTDSEKLYAILTNLLKNAIKYSDEGSIDFGYVLNTDNPPGELVFYVKDTGIGIPEERQEAIFERFIQADIEDKKARQGAGLGLTISKSYVEMLGGRIWVESDHAIGSTFYFSLPYNLVSEKVKELPTDNTIEKLNSQEPAIKILIAEDDEVSGLLLKIALKIFGKSILGAQNGLEAVEICRTNPDIDLILMDIQMPIMNGYEATRLIRQFNKEVTIIAQTAYGLSGDREIALAAGCNDYIAKPVNKAELLTIIHKYFRKNAHRH